MNRRYSWVLGIGLGTLLGYFFGVQHGDMWLGTVIAVVSSIAGYGLFAYPEYRTRWSAPEGYSKFWYAVVGVLGPVIVLVPPNSTLLTDDIAVLVLLGGIWLGGIYAGVALARESSTPTDT